MVAGPQTPRAYHFSTSALAARKAADAHKCLENKTGMKKEEGEKENKRERTRRKKAVKTKKENNGRRSPIRAVK